MSRGREADGTGRAHVIPITGDLDLHPFLPAEIPSVVVDYVHACRARGILHLRLAHGRGRGVQRAAVRRQLASMPEVAGFSDAPAVAGGWGATVVELSPPEPGEGDDAEGPTRS